MKKSILILHASAQDGARIVAALSTKHFDVTCHSDARGAFASLGSHKPDFVVVDMDQTLADGTKLCRLIRADALTQRIPILLLTRKGMAAMFGIAVDLGAQGVASGDTPEQQAEDLTVLLERRRPHLPLHEKKRMSTLRSLAVLDTPNDRIKEVFFSTERLNRWVVRSAFWGVGTHTGVGLRGPASCGCRAAWLAA